MLYNLIINLKCVLLIYIIIFFISFAAYSIDIHVNKNINIYLNNRWYFFVIMPYMYNKFQKMLFKKKTKFM